MPVFQVDRNFKVIVNPEAAKLVPELQSLTEDELRYVILVADYVDGPLRKQPIEERCLIASRIVYGKDARIKENEKIKNAIDLYKGLIFDVRRETVDLLKSKVERLHRELMRDKISSREIQEVDKSISFLEKRITSIEHDLDIDEQEKIELRGSRSLSMIETWQRNQKKQQEFKQQSI